MSKNNQLSQAISIWKEDPVTSTLLRVLNEEKQSIEHSLLSNIHRKKDCVELSQEYNFLLGKLQVINLILKSEFIDNERSDDSDE